MIISKILLELFFSFLGTLSFAILFDVPKKYYLTCGTIGATGWIIYYIIDTYTGQNILATFVSSLILICLSREAAYSKKAPVTVFLICGIFCLVPGVGLYNFTYEFFVSNTSNLSKSMIYVVKVAIAISLGISVGYELPAVFFGGYRAQKKKRGGLSSE
ncbi:threonine/serine exporter family protein [Enterococcus sp. AZ126]|uniref:threonine/serine exporter family protein n=1 Tax=Enterococcus sp. AZ126 TaxID=2774635 RepID=UPI003F255EA7